MMSRADFENSLAAILNGDWQARSKLLHYFKLEERLFKKADPQKEEQKTTCFNFMSKAVGDNNSNAMAFLAELYSDGIGVEKDKIRSLELINTAVDVFQNPTAQYQLGWYLWIEGPQKNQTKALELFRQAANQGHAGAQGALGSLLETGDEKDRWNRLAIEQGDPEALNASCCPSLWGNPFNLYMPTNKDIKITWEQNKEIDRVQGNKVSYKAPFYSVKIEYLGSAPIAQRVFNYKVENPWDKAYQESLSLAKVSNASVCGTALFYFITFPVTIWFAAYACISDGCSCNWCKDANRDDSDRERIARSIQDVSWEKSVSELMRKTDDIITQHLAYVKNYAQLGQSQFFQSPPQSGGMLQNSGNPPSEVPAQYYAEGAPFLHDYKEPSAPPPYSSIVPQYKPLEIEEHKERVVHVQGGASLRMGGSRK